MPPGQKNQQSCPAFPDIHSLLISCLGAIFHTVKERIGWYANFVSNGSAVIVCRSKLVMSFILTNATGSYISNILLDFFPVIFQCSAGPTPHFKNIFRQLLNCKILSQNFLSNSNSIWIYHKQKTGFVKIYVDYWLNRCVESCSKLIVPLTKIN